MPLARGRPRPTGNRLRRHADALPEVPVLVPPASKSDDAKIAQPQRQATPEPDAVDEKVRRMVEAAYT